MRSWISPDKLGWEPGAWASALSDVLSHPRDAFERSWLGQAALWGAVLAPMIFILFAIAVGALTHPFWDHIETARYIVRYLDGSLSAADLFAPHNEHRPVVMRIIQIALAKYTHWNIRAEFAITYTSLVVTFAVLAAAAHANIRESGRVPTLLLVALSTLIFSPADHNNLWWSFMIAMTFTAMFAYGAFALCSSPRPRWLNTIAATMLCWLSVFSVANGLLTFIVCLLVASLHAIAHNDHKVKRRIIAGWFAAHLALAAWISLQAASPPRTIAPLINIVLFLVVFLGAPAEGLLSNPYTSMWDFPRPYAVAGFLGVVALVGAVWAVGVSWRRAQRGHAVAMFAIACIAFAIGSGLLIAIGRAAGEFGVAAALSSRYTIFGTFLYVGFLFAVSAHEADGAGAASSTGWTKRALAVACAALLVMATAAYVRSRTVFMQAAGHDTALAHAYALDAGAAKFYDSVYPDPRAVPQIKADLLRLRIGPYRSVAVDDIVFDPGQSPFAPTPLNSGGWVSQRLDAPPADLCGLRYQIVTWGSRLEAGQLAWRVTRADVTDASLTEGVLDLKGRSDWETIEVPVIGADVSPIVVEFRPASNTSQLYGLPTHIGGASTANPVQTALPDGASTQAKALSFAYRVCH